MNVASALLVGYMIFDFAPAAVPEPAQISKTSFSNSGVGELLVNVAAVSVGSVPRGASRIPLATLTFSASCDADIKVTSVDVKHTGLGSAADLSSIYLSDGTRRISRSRGFDSSRYEAQLRVLSPIIVEKCGVKVIQVLADISTEADPAGEHGVTITSPEGIVSDAKATTLEFGSEAARTVTTPYRQGRITVDFLPVNTRFRYGRSEVVARIQLTADSKSSHLLQKLTLTNLEGARDMDLLNFRLETRDGTLLSGPAVRMYGREVRLEFWPSFLLRKSQTVVLVLKGQINASQRKKIDFTLLEPSDLVSIPSRE